MSNREQREQRKAEQRAQAAMQNSSKRNKYLMIGGAVLIIIAAFIFIQSSRNGAVESGVTPDPVKGNPEATVRVQLYEDFQCPACQAFEPFVQAAQAAFGDKVAFEFNDLPLTQLHPNAQFAAEAGQCAFAQDKFWEFHDTVYREQRVWEGLKDPRAQFVTYATDLGLNVDTFNTCLDNGDGKASIREDVKEANKANVQSTPTVFINGERYVNDSTYDSFAKAISEALAATAPADATNTTK